MKISNPAKYVIGVSAAVALLAGCTSSGGSQLAPGGAVTPGGVHQTMGGNHKVDLSMTLVTPKSVKPNLSRKVKDMARVKPNCCALQKTLAVTDAVGGSSFTGAVYLFDYNTGAAMGSLAPPPSGWLEPQGACTDKSGNFFVANTAVSTVEEYTHSGTYVATLADPGQFPVGCASDRTTGNLAVSNIIDVSGGPGSIVIYNGGVLQHTYFPPNLSPYFLAYEDGTGILWVDGLDSAGMFQYDSFSGGLFTPVTICCVSIAFPGALMWSGKVKSMVVGDQGTTFYQVSDTGKITGSTVLQCTQQSDFCDIVQATIKGPGIVGPDAIHLGAARFAFPAGGSPILQYSAPFVQPIGSAISSNKNGG